MKTKTNKYGVEVPKACRENAYGEAHMYHVRPEYVKAHREAAENTLSRMVDEGEISEIIMFSTRDGGWMDKMKVLQVTVRIGNEFKVIEWHDQGCFMEVYPSGGRGTLRC